MSHAITSQLLHTTHATQYSTVSLNSISFSMPGTGIMMDLVSATSTLSIVKVVIEIRPAHAKSDEQAGNAVKTSVVRTFATRNKHGTAVQDEATILQHCR